ncbi:MAG TPA: NlpC/P60 family protein [Anaeromyxobacteraceae bacterium]|nr:NlpC/P60 family protein [Anaeromyxobacteraceae bacterium]
MPRASRLLLLALALLTACAGVGRSSGGADVETARLQARIAARARAHLGHAGAFRVGAERFAADCSGFVEAVYEAEGVPLRRLMHEVAPKERSGVSALWRTVERYGEVLPPDAWPVPGDLVFWHDTFDRDRNGRRGDRLTHMGVVLWVDDDTIAFVHRGSKAVQRGSMTVVRRSDRRDGDGNELNTPLRFRDGKGGPVLAAELLAGYGRIDPGKVR